MKLGLEVILNLVSLMDTGLSKVLYSLRITQCYMVNAPAFSGEPLMYVQRIYPYILKDLVESFQTI